MIYLIFLEAITIILAFFIKLVAFYFLIKIFNRTVKFSKILKPILLYESAVLLFILIIPEVLSYPLRLLSVYLSIIASLLFLLIIIAGAFFIFYFIMHKFSVLNWKKSLIVFLLMFIIITPVICLSRVSLITKLPISSDETSKLYLLDQPTLFHYLPLSIKALKILRKLDESILEGKFLKEMRIFLITR